MIIYFSGTGNSRFAANEVARHLGETDVRQFSDELLRHPELSTIEIAADDNRIIWVFPTYSWGIPSVVANVMKKVAFGKNSGAATHSMLTTCGDDMAYTDRQWRRIMKKRGLKAAGAYAVQMQNTYVCMKGFDIDSAELASKKIEESKPVLAEIASNIANGGPDRYVRLPWSWIKSYVIYPWFMRFATSPKPFHTNEGCTSCGACARLCPMGNISMKNQKPHWDDHCALCLRCYHSCPRHAIEYGKSTDGKGQYLFRK